MESAVQERFQAALRMLLEKLRLHLAHLPMCQWMYIANIIYGPTLFLIKSTILLQYLRVFVPNRKMNMGMFIAIYAAIGTLFTFYLILTAFYIFMCHPRKKFWTVWVRGSCYNIDASLKAPALFNVFSNIYILLLPIPSIRKLQVVTKRKIGILVVLAAGVL